MWGMLRAVAIAVLFLSLTASPAGAGVAWCEDDPLITVHGRQLHATVGFDAANLPYLKNSVTYWLVVAQSHAADASIDASMAWLPTQAFTYVVTDDQMTTWVGDANKLVVAVQLQAKHDHDFDYVVSVNDFSQLFIQQLGGTTKGGWVYVTFDVH
jgi:hypothetical protein